jgi:adenosylcobinamide-GDP ribazoletransferase
MSAQWRLFVAALRLTCLPASAADPAGVRQYEAVRFVPVAGIVVGIVGAGVYWLAAQAWPTSVAVVLSMFATDLCTAGSEQRGGVVWIFLLLIKYNVLMALSAAHAPLALPEYLTLGLIMIAGYAASRALVVSVMATQAAAARGVSAQELAVALVLGLAPAALLGIPGLIGLAASIAMRLALGAHSLSRLMADLRRRLDLTAQLTEVCFYLGALATWQYV